MGALNYPFVYRIFSWCAKGIVIIGNVHRLMPRTGVSLFYNYNMVIPLTHHIKQPFSGHYVNGFLSPACGGREKTSQ